MFRVLLNCRVERFETFFQFCEKFNIVLEIGLQLVYVERLGIVDCLLVVLKHSVNLAENSLDPLAAVDQFRQIPTDGDSSVIE